MQNEQLDEEAAFPWKSLLEQVDDLLKVEKLVVSLLLSGKPQNSISKQ